MFVFRKVTRKGFEKSINAILDFGFWIGLVSKPNLFLIELILYRKHVKQRSHFLMRSQSKIQNPKSKIASWIAEKALFSYTLIAILDVQNIFIYCADNPE